MFTGIVEEMGRVLAMEHGDLHIGAGVALEGTRLGDSICVSGTCLTVTALDGTSFTAHVVAETLRRTNLGVLRRSDAVNLERALAYGGRMGGHMVQGHVDATGAVIDITPDGDGVMLRVQAPPEVMRYVVQKGFIAVNGASLTVAGRGADWFGVALIPMTRSMTNLGSLERGSAVNLEADVLAKYVERLLEGRAGGSL
ncbi:MAG: riboflavin synthase [Dehalococcoidia bacterium]|nr:riboflavin synthase [Dehalococcoidia bacterium]